MASSLKIRVEHGIQCMPCSSQIISEMLTEIRIRAKCDFLKCIIHSQFICLFSLHMHKAFVKFLYIGTVVSQQTVQSHSRLVLKEQTDQGLHLMVFHLHPLTQYM